MRSHNSSVTFALIVGAFLSIIMTWVLVGTYNQEQLCRNTLLYAANMTLCNQDARTFAIIGAVDTAAIVLTMVAGFTLIFQKERYR